MQIDVKLIIKNKLYQWVKAITKSRQIELIKRHDDEERKTMIINYENRIRLITCCKTLEISIDLYFCFHSLTSFFVC